MWERGKQSGAWQQRAGGINGTVQYAGHQRIFPRVVLHADYRLESDNYMHVNVSVYWQFLPVAHARTLS